MSHHVETMGKPLLVGIYRGMNHSQVPWVVQMFPVTVGARGAILDGRNQKETNHQGSILRNSYDFVGAR